MQLVTATVHWPDILHPGHNTPGAIYACTPEAAWQLWYQLDGRFDRGDPKIIKVELTDPQGHWLLEPRKGVAEMYTQIVGQYKIHL